MVKSSICCDWNEDCVPPPRPALWSQYDSQSPRKLYTNAKLVANYYSTHTAWSTQHKIVRVRRGRHHCNGGDFPSAHAGREGGGGGGHIHVILNPKRAAATYYVVASTESISYLPDFCRRFLCASTVVQRSGSGGRYDNLRIRRCATSIPSEG